MREARTLNTRVSRLKLPSITTPLAARLFDTDFHETNSAAGKFSPHLSANLVRYVLRQQLGAGIDQWQENDIAARQNNALLAIENFNVLGAPMHFEHGTLGLDHRAVIESIANLFYDWLESDEIQHHARMVKFTFHLYRDLIVVTVQRFSLPIGKNQEMRRCEIKIVFCNFDAESARHGLDVSQNLLRFQVELSVIRCYQKSRTLAILTCNVGANALPEKSIS